MLQCYTVQILHTELKESCNMRFSIVISSLGVISSYVAVKILFIYLFNEENLDLWIRYIDVCQDLTLIVMLNLTPTLFGEIMTFSSSCKNIIEYTHTHTHTLHTRHIMLHSFRQLNQSKPCIIESCGFQCLSPWQPNSIWQAITRATWWQAR